MDIPPEDIEQTGPAVGVPLQPVGAVLVCPRTGYSPSMQNTGLCLERERDRENMSERTERETMGERENIRERI